MKSIKIETIKSINGLTKLRVIFACGSIGSVIVGDDCGCVTENIRDNTLYQNDDVWDAITDHMNS